MLKTVMFCAMLLAAPAQAGLFGTAEYARGAGAPLDTWQAMVARQSGRGCGPAETAFRPFDDMISGAGVPAGMAACGSPALDTHALVQELNHETLARQLDTVNAAVNRVPYVEDSANYGVADYWASIDQFLTRGGDCEDFATAKYMLLREAGVPEAAMRVVVVRDTLLGTAHAILSVVVDGEAYILDNQAADVKPARAVTRYQPVYSINGTGWWLHMPQG